MQHQQNNKALIEISTSNKDYSIKHFHGEDKKYYFICSKHKIVIPKLEEKQIVELYHNFLCHSNETCTELSIAQYFYWKNLRKTAHEVCLKCKACKFLKRNKKEYGKLPSKKQKANLGMYYA